ncbi:MAG: hypothetical protein SO181_11365 [Frisingicoccus sp.]|uniref:hypothetical protein n=1 Tax=Frisingicoccus sp. TaxID=1918627 RepID=UPI002A8046B1|nr:hypothetical protein [Frisingicoccus sp.]MDY4835722.1 hypothetical protein [Frisingicoccus sp.]
MGNKKRMIKMFSLLTIMFILSFSLNVNAEGGIDNNDYSNEVVPGHEKTERWSYTSSINSYLTIDTNGSSTSTCTVTGYQSLATKIIIYTYLQKYQNGSWVSVDSGSSTFYSWHAAIEYPFSVYASWGRDYRTYNSIYVYSGDSYEHINAYSNVHHYHSSSDSSNCIS